MAGAKRNIGREHGFHAQHQRCVQAGNRRRQCADCGRGVNDSAALGWRED